MFIRRKLHVPDLSLLASLSAANYARLLKLTRDLRPGDQNVFSVRNGSQPASRISVKIEADHRYTTMLKLSHEHTGGTWPGSHEMQVRMYHDARMAEVVGYQKVRVTEGRFPYPNPAMLQPDEKTQLNRFLADWLEHCLQFGHIDREVRLQSDAAGITGENHQAGQ